MFNAGDKVKIICNDWSEMTSQFKVNRTYRYRYDRYEELVVDEKKCWLYLDEFNKLVGDEITVVSVVDSRYIIAYLEGYKEVYIPQSMIASSYQDSDDAFNMSDIELIL